MVTLPLLYRVWLHYHPQPAEQRTSLSDFLAKSAEACALQLIQTPLSKWTELDRKSEPSIHAWLVAHENVILPWEWTEEAKRKDPSGCSKMWHAIVKEQKRKLDKRIDSAQRQIRRLCIAKELFARAVELENLADLNDSICLVELCHFLKSGETLERN